MTSFLQIFENVISSLHGWIYFYTLSNDDSSFCLLNCILYFTLHV